MTLLCIDPPAAPAGRPMSLLLQALKQIELKAPIETPADSPGASRAIEPEFEPGEPPPCETYELIRQYAESETASEVALAGPVYISARPLPAAPAEASVEAPAEVPVEVAVEIPAARPPWRADRRQRRLAGQVAELLPDEDRAVIALLSLDETEVWPLLHDLGAGLAARSAGDVLAIAETPAASSPKGSGRAPFTEVLSGRAAWRDALAPGRQTALSVIERGAPEAIPTGAGRSLLELWQDMSEQFAYVLIDATSPEPDAALSLLASCDAVFIVLRLNGARRRETERWLERIRSVGGQPCGCLLLD